MSEEITIIVARSYQFGMTWLRQNYKKYNLDPQLCRITTKPDLFMALRNVTVIWLRGWAVTPAASRIRAAAQASRAKGYIKQEIAP